MALVRRDIEGLQNHFILEFPQALK
ncbi:hypothetical protein MPLA_1230007 [Mesorhizobium sp. ORS 3359]|nr:hypothetical protein MPLA_1230007 [Mesorhizobium sp. ORS 3359]